MVAVMGALAATPQVRGLALGSPANPAGTGAIAPLSFSGGTVGPPANNPIWFGGSGNPRGRAAVQSASRPAGQQASNQSGRSGPARGRPPRPGQSAGQPGQQGQPSPSPAASASPSRQPGSSSGQSGSSARTLSCTGTAGPLPANYATIVTFLTAHGYTGFAAAGIAGNIYQESGGNPESVGSGGGGLIGWTPLPPGFVTGNPAADLRTQLAALLTYNQQWSQYIPALNAATSATSAAYIYMIDFERPGIPAAANREAAASAVARACGL